MKFRVSVTGTLDVPDGTRYEYGMLILPNGREIEVGIILGGLTGQPVTFVQDRTDEHTFQPVTDLPGDVIRAYVRRDDWNPGWDLNVRFDARPWFVQASDDDIRRVIRQGMDDTPACSMVAEFAAEHDPKVADVTVSARNAGIPVHCTVDWHSLVAWLRSARSDTLYLEISGDTPPERENDHLDDDDEDAPPAEFRHVTHDVTGQQVGQETDFDYACDLQPFFASCTPAEILRMTRGEFQDDATQRRLNAMMDAQYARDYPQDPARHTPANEALTTVVSVDLLALNWWLRARAGRSRDWAFAHQAVRRLALKQWPEDEVDFGNR